MTYKTILSDPTEWNEIEIIKCTLCHNDLDEMMKSKGVSIYLRCEEEVLFDRIINDKVVRPLVSGKNSTSIRQFINDKLKIRKSNYLKANIIIDNNEDGDSALNKILNILKV